MEIKSLKEMTKRIPFEFEEVLTINDRFRTVIVKGEFDSECDPMESVEYGVYRNHTDITMDMTGEQCYEVRESVWNYFRELGIVRTNCINL